jgi:hypothetical protein
MGRLLLTLLVLRLLLAGFSVHVQATPALFAKTLRALLGVTGAEAG